MAKCTRYKNRDTVSTFKISPSKVCEYTLPHWAPSTGYHEHGKTLAYRHVLSSPNFYLMLNQMVAITTTTIMILCWYVLPLISVNYQINLTPTSTVLSQQKIKYDCEKTLSDIIIQMKHKIATTMLLTTVMAWVQLF